LRAIIRTQRCTLASQFINNGKLIAKMLSKDA